MGTYANVSGLSAPEGDTDDKGRDGKEQCSGGGAGDEAGGPARGDGREDATGNEGSDGSGSKRPGIGRVVKTTVLFRDLVRACATACAGYSSI